MMPLPDSLSWIQQHQAWLLLTLVMMAMTYVRSASSRQHIRTSLVLMVLLALAALTVRNQTAWLGNSIPPAIQASLIDLAAGLLIIRVWGGIAFKLLLPVLRLHPPLIIADITVSFCYLIWCAIRLHVAGMALGEIITTSAVLTAIIAFALQDTLGNLLAGIAIQLDDSIHVGDWIEHEGVTGKVSEINWRATSIETRNWETVVIPNSLLLKNRFMVLGKRYHQPVQWRRWVWFDLSLETLPTQIISLIEKSLQETRIPHVARTPPPNCVLMKVENGIARYAVRYWLTDLQMDDPTDSAIRTQIDAALRRNDRRMSPPIFNVLMTKEKYAVDVRHKRHQQERLTHLRRLSLFQMLTEDELCELADELKFTPFVAGDTMLEQGEISDWLFILVAGEADMLVSQAEHDPVLLGKLSSGSFFGEMGLLTGEPSAYSVRAIGAVECYRVGRETFHSIFLERDELVSALSEVLQTRLKEQQRLLENLHLQTPPREAGAMMASLRRFFGQE
ncbi:MULTISPECIES: mechanosensitive ion channel family protein [unclassified Paludibacterium]|uniref:mechanosensitive ion channel family protein n=1 Tax=unclassified Paludibacterium TaxID=2618429 RepID=UPI001C03A858|nr:mechanosensitive ion channel family protein [Paludibacterium sp. B53371]BEV71642.1 mechanosensitive ion channel family protein [Paludibacterium sp. THUN1379]